MEKKILANINKLQIGESVKFLGMVRDVEGLHVDPDRAKAIDAFQVPQNAKELRSFLGVVRYINASAKRLSEVVAPLNELLTKKAKWEWSERHDAAWREAKEICKDTIVRAIPRKDLPWHINTDASDDGVGGYLYQIDGEGKERIIMAFSKAFTGAQKNWATVEQEAYAVVYAVNKCAHFVAGKHFTVHTDHRPLLSLAKQVHDSNANQKLHN